MEKLGWKIFWLIGSIAVIIGGLSGEFVLRGTNNSEALVVVGFISLAANIISIATHGRSKRKLKQRQAETTANAEQFTEAVLAKPQSIDSQTQYQYDITLRPLNMFKLEQYQLHLNGEQLGKISSGNRKCTISTSKVQNVLCAVNEKNGAKAYIFFEAVQAPLKKDCFMLSAGNWVYIGGKKGGLNILQPS